ncbi:putative leader peptide [Streptomyces sp. NBC_00138]
MGHPVRCLNEPVTRTTALTRRLHVDLQRVGASVCPRF